MIYTIKVYNYINLKFKKLIDFKMYKSYYYIVKLKIQLNSFEMKERLN